MPLLFRLTNPFCIVILILPLLATTVKVSRMPRACTFCRRTQLPAPARRVPACCVPGIKEVFDFRRPYGVVFAGAVELPYRDETMSTDLQHAKAREGE
ncbi:hypothetical protein LZ32DRAFT_602879 [Colletotrichum eremochloae]|nr:hypothetical protein LZ32DRAFT_602879 [Colletotrichum eremochloae]